MSLQRLQHKRALQVIMESASQSVRAGTLDQHRVASIPESMYYIPDFITEDEEAHILSRVCRNSVISATFC